jgi:hypothetical protein
MRAVLVLCLIVFGAYGWFAYVYEPKPSSSSMQGVMNGFQQAIMDKDLEGMRRACTGSAVDSCDRIYEYVDRYENRYGISVGAVRSLNFNYTRGRKAIDGMIFVEDTDGDQMMHLPLIRIEHNESAGFWAITLIQGV